MEKEPLLVEMEMELEQVGVDREVIPAVGEVVGLCSYLNSIFDITGRQVSVSKRVHDCTLKISKIVYNFCPPEVCVLAHCLPTHLANHNPVSKACTKLHNNVTVHAVYSHLISVILV